MNTHRKNNTEPTRVSVEIITNDPDRRIILTNDGISTSRSEKGIAESTIILQNRAAFRGFVGALTELMDWDTARAWDSSEYTTEKLHYEGDTSEPLRQRIIDTMF